MEKIAHTKENYPPICSTSGREVDLEKGLFFCLSVQLSDIFFDVLAEPKELRLSAEQGVDFFYNSALAEVANIIIKDLQGLWKDKKGNPFLHGVISLEMLTKYKDNYCKELVSWLEEAESVAKKEDKKMFVFVGGYEKTLKLNLPRLPHFYNNVITQMRDRKWTTARVKCCVADIWYSIFVDMLGYRQDCSSITIIFEKGYSNKKSFSVELSLSGQILDTGLSYTFLTDFLQKFDNRFDNSIENKYVTFLSKSKTIVIDE